MFLKTVFRGKLYCDRFKTKLSEYIPSPSLVFELPFAPLCLVFSDGGWGEEVLTGVQPFGSHHWHGPRPWFPAVLCLT